MPLDELHERVAAIALGAAAGHGFALGGGNALIAHGIIDRPAQDVDLFSDREHAVEAASDAVTEALGRSGFRTEAMDKTAIPQIHAALCGERLTVTVTADLPVRHEWPVDPPVHVTAGSLSL